jgi:hypothetical protein
MRKHKMHESNTGTNAWRGFHIIKCSSFRFLSVWQKFLSIFWKFDYKIFQVFWRLYILEIFFIIIFIWIKIESFSKNYRLIKKLKIWLFIALEIKFIQNFLLNRDSVKQRIDLRNSNTLSFYIKWDSSKWHLINGFFGSIAVLLC